MPDSPPVDRKVEALERVDKARHSVKIAEEALQAVSSEYDRVMSIKAGTKGGGKGAKREATNIKNHAADVWAQAQAELEVAMLMVNALNTPPPDVEMSEGGSTKSTEPNREEDSVEGDEGDEGDEKGVDDAKVGNGNVSPNGDRKEGEDNQMLAGNPISTKGYPDSDDSSWPSDTDEEKEDAKYLAVRKDKKDVELSTDDLKLFRFLPIVEQEAQTKIGMDAIHAFLKEGTAIPDKISRMARLDPTYLPKAAMTSSALALQFVTSGQGNIQCGYHAYRNKSCYNRDGWGKPGSKIHGVPGKRKVTNSRSKAVVGASKKPTVQPSKKGFAHCGCRIDDCLLEFFLSKILKISGRVAGKKVEEGMFGCYDYQPPRARSFMHEAFWTFTGPLTLDHIYDEDMDETKYGCNFNEFMAKEYIDLFNSSLKDMQGKDAQRYTLVSTERLHQLEEIEKGVMEGMVVD